MSPSIKRPARFRDEQASARLLFAPELETLMLTSADVDQPEVWAALSSKPIPTRASRALQRGMVRRGALGFEETTVPAFVAARRAVLDDAAAGPPRPLIRLRGIPSDAVRNAFDDARVAYVVGAAPAQAAGERVVVVAAEELGLKAWPALAQRFDVICAEPDAVGTMGFHHPALFRRGAVYLPTYPPLAGSAAGAAAVLERLREAQAALWVPLAVNADDPDLPRLLDAAAGLDDSWDALLRTLGRLSF